MLGNDCFGDPTWGELEPNASPVYGLQLAVGTYEPERFREGPLDAPQGREDFTYTPSWISRLAPDHEGVVEDDMYRAAEEAIERTVQNDKRFPTAVTVVYHHGGQIDVTSSFN